MNRSPSLLLREARRLAGISQRALAARAGRCQSVVANIERGRVSPSWRTLVDLLAAAGFEVRAALRPRRRRAPASDPVTGVYRRDLDRSLLLRNLRRTPEQRIVAAGELLRLAERARRAGEEFRGR